MPVPKISSASLLTATQEQTIAGSNIAEARQTAETMQYHLILTILIKFVAFSRACDPIVCGGGRRRMGRLPSVWE